MSDQHQSAFEKDHQVATKEMNLVDHMLYVQKHTGKSMFKQVRDVLKLRRAPGGLDVNDYYYFGLYNDDRIPPEEKERFLSDRLHGGIIDKCCAHEAWMDADDKLAANRILEETGLRVAETMAIYSPVDRNEGGMTRLENLDEVKQFLRDHASAPIFAKPLEGIGSFGTFLIEGVDNDIVQLRGADPMAIDDFAQTLDIDQGYIFQKVLRHHAALEQFGTAISTIRVIVIVVDGQPEIIHTIWKIPTGSNIADNFWRGNLLGAVDLETGKVNQVVGGVSHDRRVYETHPDTGASFNDLQLPDWDRLREDCLKGARRYSAIAYQSWDIALCDNGPVVVEVNTGSSFHLSQLATDKGFLTDKFKSFLDSYGYTLK